MNHLAYQKDDTIAAIATPPGEGGVAIIRVSGRDAIAVADRVFSGDVPSYASHTAHYGYILDSEGRRIDDGLCLVMLNSRSFTGESCAEIQCHGGSLIARQVLEAVFHAGARPAEPGEFSYRAFLNGRLDLAQAEAIQELIGAKNELALQAARDRLDGSLSRKVATFQQKLTDITAIFEAWVDFPEEGLEFLSQEEMRNSIETLKESIDRLIATFHHGRMLQEGIAIALVGAPNVGKSSLLNRLLEKERAIVTPIPGTTRDLIEESMTLGGVHLRVIDTAGVRKTDETVEAEGIRRSLSTMAEADIVLLLLDASAKGLSTEELELIDALQDKKALLVWNKCDLGEPSHSQDHFTHQVQISAKEGRGVDQLKEELLDLLFTGGLPSKGELVITSLRHKESLARCSKHLEELLDGLKANISPEFLTIEARGGLVALSQIMGHDITEDVLSSIFARFCIGK